MPRRHFVIYPFVVALYGVLALAASNIREVVWLGVLVVPITTVLVVAAAAWILSRAVSGDVHVRALVALAVILWFSWYGYFQRALVKQPLLFGLSKHQYAIPAYLLLLCASVYAIVRRYPRPLSDLTRYLNVTAAVLILIPTVTLFRDHGLRSEDAHDRGIKSRTPPVLASGAVRPSIYLIILDKYTDAHSLAVNYDFDNSQFVDSLRRLGFTVPRAPQANYVHTHLALSALLNWHLLDDRPADLTASGGALPLDYAAIEDNRSWEFLNQLGYRFVFFPSAYPATARNRHADLQLPDPRQVTSEFEVVWLRNTLAMPVRQWWCRVVGCSSGKFPYTPAPPALIDWKLQQLAQLPESGGTVFAFAHFTVPHEPYVFRADCTPREPYWPLADSAADELPVKQAYVDQIECVNRKVLRLVDTLLAKSTTPPIIILQSDHGHGRLGRTIPAFAVADSDRVAERTGIFAAYYLPGHPSGVVYDSITPVNVLPRIFNHYFDARIPLQPDATYWSTWEEPFKFTRIR